MSVTTRDVVLDADLFRRAQPHWLHPEPDDERRCASCGHPAWLECGCLCCPYAEGEGGADFT